MSTHLQYQYVLAVISDYIKKRKWIHEYNVYVQKSSVYGTLNYVQNLGRTLTHHFTRNKKTCFYGSVLSGGVVKVIKNDDRVAPNQITKKIGLSRAKNMR